MRAPNRYPDDDDYDDDPPRDYDRFDRDRDDRYGDPL